MSKSCERCCKDFVPRTYSQQFCTRACSDAFYVEERREALTKLRGEETSTYHAIGEADADAPGGRWARHEPRLDPQGLPAALWSHDPTGSEPLVDGRAEGLSFGRPIDE